MKPFIYFEPTLQDYAYEGARLRKNLKGALELLGVTWVSSLFASPSLVHFLSPEDDGKAKEVAGEGTPVVTSAFYGESDPFTRFLTTDLSSKLVLRKNAEKLLQTSSLVLVPNSEGKTFLRQAGITCPIEVVTPGVNLSRFESNDEIEASLFSRYVSLPPNAQYVLAKGDYGDNEVLKALNSIANLCPNFRFYFVGMGKHGRSNRGARARLKRNGPKNLFYLDVLDDDIYRSAMMGAQVYLSFAFSHPDVITPLEAMASQTQVYSLGPDLLGSIITNGKNGLCFDNIESLSSSLQSYCADAANSTIIGGYKEAKANSLLSLGKALVSTYKQLLKEGD
jgi:1,2-diacylglycerol-3-alpha-glucose alpha-1,2-glucosyltransferase